LVDSNTADQLEYENAVKQVRDAVREMRAEGTNFSNKKERKAFTDNIISTAKRLAHDKRIWD
jgi:hypothetical protein